MQHSSAESHNLSLSLTERVDSRRLSINNRLDPKEKIKRGQFMTSCSVAQFMTSMFDAEDSQDVNLLDAGAGIGSLTAAFVEEFSRRGSQTHRIAVTAYELDPIMVSGLQSTFTDCTEICEAAEIKFEPELKQVDFIRDGTDQLLADPMSLFPPAKPPVRYTHAILNPPYKKIHSASDHRLLLRSVGIETSNLYTGFLAVAIKLLASGGELVAITPRSFCNGPYFKPFRELLLGEMSLKRIHIFEGRTHAFKDDEVLQENIIFHAVKHQPHSQTTISLSESLDFSQTKSRTVDFFKIVHRNDPEKFIHIITNEEDQGHIERMYALPCTLHDLGIAVSTGPVVDFRLRKYLRKEPKPGMVPLIHPSHCQNYFVVWPTRNGKKSNALMDAAPIQKWLYPNGYYIVVRRFSSKEERRRVVAAIHEPSAVPGEKIGFENHLNVFHNNKHGLTPVLARGLAVYLNSTFYDICFRQFNGHTQVNVKDLYNLRYPDQAVLERLGERVKRTNFPPQKTIDTWIDEELF